jgi:sulfur-oxidizing protein SoxY
MNHSRRDALKAGSSLALYSALLAMGMVKPGDAWAEAWNKGMFETKSVADALKALGASAPTMTSDVLITAPDIAENGAVVPVAAVSKLPKTQQIAYLIEKNPNTVTAVFDIPDGTLPEVQTRVKMGQTSNVMILVKADGRYYATQKEIKVTVGGCGG